MTFTGWDRFYVLPSPTFLLCCTTVSLWVWWFVLFSLFSGTIEKWRDVGDATGSLIHGHFLTNVLCLVLLWLNSRGTTGQLQKRFIPTCSKPSKWVKCLIFVIELHLTVCLARLLPSFVLLMWLMPVPTPVTSTKRLNHGRELLTTVRARECVCACCTDWLTSGMVLMTSLRLRALNWTRFHRSCAWLHIYKPEPTLLIWCPLA